LKRLSYLSVEPSEKSIKKYKRSRNLV